MFLGFPCGSDKEESGCNAETSVQYLSWEDLLEEGMATHSSILAWRIPLGRGAWGATVPGVAKSRTRLGDGAHSAWPLMVVWILMEGSG